MCDCSAFPNPPSLNRRRLLLGAAAVGAAGWLGASEAATDSNEVGADEAMKRLMAGNARYVANKPRVRDFSAGRVARAKTQRPIAAILGCSDSRVAPELAFDQGPGDLFIVRVAGNFVNDDGLASLEYATVFLHAPLIMVLGHSNCGAVEGAVKVLKDKAELPGHLPGLMQSLAPAVELASKSDPTNLVAASIKENVRLMVARLSTAGPVLQDLVMQKKLGVVGGVYDLATGKVNLV